MTDTVNMILAEMNISDFRKFKRAYRIMRVANIPQADAVRILITAHLNELQRRDEQRLRRIS